MRRQQGGDRILSFGKFIKGYLGLPGSVTLPLARSAGLALLVSAGGVAAQETFQNLNFEAAEIPSGTPPLSEFSFGIALPGWSGSKSNANGIQTFTFVGYDGMSLGGPIINVIDTHNVGASPLQGSYSAYLFGGNEPFGGLTSSTISQTGLVPTGALAIYMDVYAWSGFTVSLDGKTINMVPVQTFDSYTLYSGDVSAFAGQTAQLSITVPSSPYMDPNPNGLLIDDIEFTVSSTPQPIWLNTRIMAGQLVMEWGDSSFNLQTAPSLTGPWVNVPGAASPYTNTISGAQGFFRLKSDWANQVSRSGYRTQRKR